jgi:hypothetical protein
MTEVSSSTLITLGAGGMAQVVEHLGPIPSTTHKKKKPSQIGRIHLKKKYIAPSISCLQEIQRFTLGPKHK